MSKRQSIPDLLPPKIDQRRTVGRPSGYRPEFCDVLLKVAENDDPHNYGINCAYALKVSRDAIWEWRNKYPEFANAYKQGLIIWERRLNTLALNSKMDFKYYRSFIFRVLGENCEPSTKIEQESHITVEGLQNLQHLNRS